MSSIQGYDREIVMTLAVGAGVYFGVNHVSRAAVRLANGENPFGEVLISACLFGASAIVLARFPLDPSRVNQNPPKGSDRVADLFKRN